MVRVRAGGPSGPDLLAGCGTDVDGLQALGPLLHVEFDRLTFFEAAEAVHLNGGMMYEDIWPVHWAAR